MDGDLTLDARKHCAFWLRHLRLLPQPYTTGDDQRMTFGFFCLGALDLLLGPQLSSKLPPSEQSSYRDWIWRRQCSEGGFTGSPSSTMTEGHLAMTYTAILCLGILRDDLTRLDREGLNNFLHSHQDPSTGSFSPTRSNRHERDPRFTYCAFAICHLIDDWSAIDVEKGLSFLRRCQSFDAGFAQGPGMESHGGSAYCCVAAYRLAGRMDDLHRRDELVKWLIDRQQPNNDADMNKSQGSKEDSDDDEGNPTAISHGGFNGRINKPVDTCYSFWCGASLHLLSSSHLTDHSSNIQHLLSHQTRLGGFYKNNEQSHPDIMHSYLSLAALSLNTYSEVQLQELDPGLNCSIPTLQWIRKCLRRQS